jgi:hypothetical protein
MKKRCKLCGTPSVGIKPYCSECVKTDIHHFGDYRQGLTGDEIKKFIGLRANTTAIARLYKKFVNIAGCNTMAIGPNGEGLMYRHDVERFIGKLLFGTETYWD